MKRQEAFDRMRANRCAAELRTRIRIMEELQAMAREDDAKYAANRKRVEDFIDRANFLGQMACIPFMSREYYDDIQQQMDRLANEHGIHASKPRRDLKVVGGNQ